MVYISVDAQMALRVYLSEQLRTVSVVQGTTTAYRTTEIGNCSAQDTGPRNVLSVCPAALNRSLVAYREYVQGARGRILPGPFHELMSVSAQVDIPNGFTGEGSAEFGSAYRLRVSYQAP
jgi:hypothetical protein